MDYSTLLSVAALIYNERGKISEPTLNGNVVNCLDNLESTFGVPRKLLIDFLSRKDLRDRINRIKKGIQLSFTDIKEIFEDECKEQKTEADGDEVLKKLAHCLEDAFSKDPKAIERIQLEYLRKIEGGVDSINTKVDRIENKLDLLFELVKNSRTRNPPGSKGMKLEYHIWKPFEGVSTLTTRKFQISWPETWERIQGKELEEILDKAELDMKSKGLSFDRKGIALNLRRKSDVLRIDPAFVVGVAPALGFSLDTILEHTLAGHSYVGNKIINSFVDRIGKNFVIELKLKARGFEFYQLSETILYNNYQYVLNYNDLSEEIVERDPRIIREIEFITDSFTLV